MRFIFPKRSFSSFVGLLPFLGVLLLPWPLIAAGRVSGQIVNGTTGRPASRQTIELLTPAKGKIQQLATAETDADGRFVFDRNDINTAGFYLLQASHQGVNYHNPVRFGKDGNAFESFKIYNSSMAVPDVRITSARFLVRAQGQQVRVEELFALRNRTNPPVSFVNPSGTFRLSLAKDAGQPSVAVAGEMNMPLPQTVQTGTSPGQFSIDYPLKPGLTVVMVAYEADYSAERFSLGDSVPYPIDEAELDVLPATLAIDSRIFKPAGQDEASGGQKLIAGNLQPGETFAATFQGAPLAENGSSQNDETGTVKELPNPMTRLGWPLLGCFLLVLLWAMGVRISKEWTRRDIARPGSPALKELEAKLEKLLDSVANLDELFEAGKLPEKKYWRERLDLKAKLVVLLKKTPPAFLQAYATRHNPR